MNTTYKSLSFLFISALIGSVVTADEPVLQQDFSAGPESLNKWKLNPPEGWEVTDEGHLRGHRTGDRNIVGCRSPRFRQKGMTIRFRFQIEEGRELQLKMNHVKGGHICRFVVKSTGFHLRINRNRAIPITEAVDLERVETRISKARWHNMEIEIRGNEITGTIDGQASHTYENKYFGYEMGSVEFSANGDSILFDDLVITSLATAPDNPKRERGTGDQAMDEADHIPRSRVGLPTSPPRSNETAWLKPLQSFIAANCNDCHADGADEGGFQLETLKSDLGDEETLRRWVLLFDRVDKDEMPPKDFERPDSSQRMEFLDQLGSQLRSAHAAGREVVLRRLNRAEYENTVNDLFGTDIRLQQYLPEDASNHGFDNNGEGLTLSTELIEAYLQTADLILDRTLGPATQPERIEISKSVRELVHDNMYSRWFKLFETEGGTVIYSSEYGAGSQLNLYKTPAEGMYRFRLHTRAFQSEQPVIMQVQTGILTRSGNKRFMGFFPVPPEGRIVEFTDYMHPGESLYPRPFGTLKNISNFLQKGKRKIEEYDGPGLHISKVEIEGPIDEWPPPSRQRLLGDVELKDGTVEDARGIFARFLPRAFRRPAAAQEMDAYSDKVAELMQGGRSFEQSLRWTLRAALCSADFLFLEEPVDPSAREIGDFALANRLSYFLWSSMPDDELMAIAREGRLRDPQVLREQTERMLQSKKAAAFTENFAHQWLDLREIDATSPDTKLYPDFDEHLKFSMVRESELFFEHVLNNDLSVASFVDSDWLILNQRLAHHYGIKGVTGDEFRLVKLPTDSFRGGLMTQAGILKVTANGANTSPVTRGVWMLEKVMGIHPPPPPPNVPAVVPDVTGAKTLRQLLDAHRGESSCNSCHKVIDPPGFALESFDAIGGFREKYRFQGSRKLLPVDASGVTAKGDSFKDIREYKQLLMKEMDTITFGLAEKLLTYATGRQLGFSDREHLQSVVAASKRKNYAFRELIHQSVQSPIFKSP